MAYTQENRLIAIKTPLGNDVLLLQGFTGTEAMSRMFQFHLDLLSEHRSIAFSDIVGKRVTVKVTLASGDERYINGFVSRFAQTGSEVRFAYYQMEVVPWLWFLTRNADCRIFQNMTIPDIIQQVFKNRGFTDFKLSLTGNFEPREYCVQYRETDFNFVSRLMEQYGIFYYFEHEENKHTLVLGNSPSALQSCRYQSTARYNTAIGGWDDEDVVTGWHMEQELRTGKYSLTDYNFETPSTSLLSSDPTVFSVDGNSAFEIYDYPGIYLTKSQGDQLTKLRMQEEETPHVVITGTSVCRDFTSGYKFTLADHYRKDINEEYLITQVQHVASVAGSYATTEMSRGESYSNHFTCIPATVPFRPPRITPKPFVQGPQPALVVGKSGEEIWVDNYGRVIVQFYWDRLGKHDEKSSCWVRVSHPWAGKNWGAIWTPRIGQEVIVSFLEGDPDRPLITGRVYNAEQMPPYALPDNQTQSGFKSRSSKGGGTSNYNEIRFEDKKDKEHFLIHAERLKTETVEKDSIEMVGHDRWLTVENDQNELIKANKHLHVNKDHMEKIDGNMNVHVMGNLNEKVEQNASLKVGMSLAEKIEMNQATEVGMDVFVKAGMNLVLEAGMAITLKASGGFITIGPGGIFISGQPMVMINSGGSAVPGTSGSPTSPQDPTDPGESPDPYS
jgi:type VI secretion system secreted protein VgrG